METLSLTFSPSALREARTSRGISQEALSRLTGVTLGTIQRAEAGSNEPRATTVARIADVLGVSLDSLFAEHPDKATESAKAALKTPDPASTSAKKRARGVQ